MFGSVWHVMFGPPPASASPAQPSLLNLIYNWTNMSVQRTRLHAQNNYALRQQQRSASKKYAVQFQLMFVQSIINKSVFFNLGFTSKFWIGFWIWIDLVCWVCDCELRWGFPKQKQQAWQASEDRTLPLVYDNERIPSVHTDYLINLVLRPEIIFAWDQHWDQVHKSNFPIFDSMSAVLTTHIWKPCVRGTCPIWFLSQVQVVKNT